MEETQTICPVCTLYLRPGMTLKSHLTSHPKQKVIEALVRLANTESSASKVSMNQQHPLIHTTSVTDGTAPANSAAPSHIAQQWEIPVMPTGAPAALPGNHSFIYQQFMSSTTPHSVIGVNHLGQQYIYPTVVNPQMMCSPYVYHQQQQVIMSSAGIPTQLPRLLPIAQAELTEEEHESTEPEVSNNEMGEETEIDNSQIEETHGNITTECNTIKEIIDNMEDIDEEEDCCDDDTLVVVISNKEEVSELQIAKENQVSDQHPESESDNVEIDSKINFTRQIITQQKISSEYDRDTDTPNSNNSNFLHVDLNKSCQTQEEPLPSSSTDNYLSKIEENCMILDNNFDMDGMNLMLTPNFIPSQVIPVEDFDYSHREQSVLMNIGDYDNENQESIDSVNIRADEHMPPRGELSGQESNASHATHMSEIAWSNELIARETWENNSDDDAADMPPLQSRDVLDRPEDVMDDTPTVSGYIEPTISYKCPKCEAIFSCIKERKEHMTEMHDLNEIGSQITKKKVKKLIIKPKKSEIPSTITSGGEVKVENFDFTNKLKLEELDRSIVNNMQLEPESSGVSRAVVCSTCDLIFEDNNRLVQHRTEAHSTNEKYKCLICETTFPSEPKYTEHLTIHPLECRLCGKYFYRRQNMQLHMKRHLGIRPYKCLTCDKGFLTKQKLDEHKNVHTGEAPIKCNLCDESFRRHSNLVQHRNRHHLNLPKKLKDYLCPCGEVFHSKKKLEWHKEIHENKPKACTHCNEKFIHASSLTRHMRKAHNERFVPKEERDKENVECPICKGVFLRSSLDVHIRNHSGQRPYTCTICNKDFTTKWNLKLHKWTHAARTTKPFKCDQCKGAFIRESDYIAHMNAHKSIRPYTCNHCGAQFIRKYNCIRHVREHEKGKTFNCTVCGKSFHRSYYLKDHMRIHSGARPYGCHICGKTSATKSNHNKHLRIHHAREPVTTEN